MKLYFILIAALSIVLGNAQTITIPDANFKTALLNSNTTTGCAYNSNLNPIVVDINNDGEIQLSEAALVYQLSLTNTNISDLSGINSFINLTKLGIENNHINHLTIDSLQYLDGLDGLNSNPLISIQLNNLNNLGSISCNFNSTLTTFEATNCGILNTLEIMSCNLSTLLFTNCPYLNTINCQNNHLTNLNLSNQDHLVYLDCHLNQLTYLNINSTPNLTKLYCDYNQLTTIDLSGPRSLSEIYCSHNNLISLDTSVLPLMKLSCAYNNLHSLFLKNGYAGVLGETTFSNNPNLEFICVDDFEMSVIQNLVNQYGYSNCVVNTYCSFSPGGPNFIIQGNNRVDVNNNGCSSSNTPYPNLKFSIVNSQYSGIQICNNSGSYQIPVSYGSHTITPAIENSTYFTISPASITRDFPTDISPSTQDFCIIPNGIHNDLEVLLIPIGVARPGFDSHYKIIYKNKGTHTQNGTINFNFPDSRVDLVNSNPIVNSQTFNNLSWAFSSLLPFETREITIVINLNSPLETPAVNSGDILPFTATVTGNTDETPNDNTSNLNQTVVNSFDPNDKTCLEGTSITSNLVGQYIHYCIRFENNGTSSAQNIVVKDLIDTTKYDVTTLVPLYGSQPFVTKISNTNQVEFIFENINLPFDDASNDGYVTFKIKTKPTLVVGNSFSNKSNIYFDYNAPIITNTYTTTITNLFSNEFELNPEFSITPIPTKTKLTITSKANVIINSLRIYNTIGQLVLVMTNPSEIIDVTDLKSGSYFIQINSDKRICIYPFIKE
jgi:hypothetical protein